MSNFAPLYSPIKHFAPISLTNQSRNFPRPIYKPPPLNHNNMMNRTAFGQGIKTDFVPTSLTVPHVNQFNTYLNAQLVLKEIWLQELWFL